MVIVIVLATDRRRLSLVAELLAADDRAMPERAIRVCRDEVSTGWISAAAVDGIERDGLESSFLE